MTSKRKVRGLLKVDGQIGDELGKIGGGGYGGMKVTQRKYSVHQEKKKKCCS